MLYFYVLAARALSLASREDWTLINLIRAFRAQDGVERQFLSLSFSAFCLKDSVFLLLEKQCFVLPVLPEAIAFKSQEIVKNSLVLRRRILAKLTPDISRVAARYQPNFRRMVSRVAAGF